MSSGRVAGYARLTAGSRDTRRAMLRRRSRIDRGVTQSNARTVHRARQYPHAILQQRAVGRIVHIRFYDRRIDAKAAAVRHPRTLRHLHARV